MSIKKFVGAAFCRPLAVLAALALSAMLVVGCGDDDNPANGGGGAVPANYRGTYNAYMFYDGTDFRPWSEAGRVPHQFIFTSNTATSIGGINDGITLPINIIKHGRADALYATFEGEEIHVGTFINSGEFRMTYGFGSCVACYVTYKK